MAFRRKTLILTLAAVLAVGFSADAFARAGRGSSFGSRGARTFNAPPPTQTAPRGAAPMERSMTQPGQGNLGAAAQRPRGLFSGGFGSGLMGGLMGGLLGAGLFGMLFGHGLFGGLGSFSSILGLILQIGLLYLLFRFVMGFIRSRRPAAQGAGLGSGQGERGLFSGLVQPRENGGAGVGVFGGGSQPGGRAGPRGRRLDVAPADFEMFEKRLEAVQLAYGTQDLGALRTLTTPEMAAYFAEEIDANAKQGLVNRISDVKFLQGDLSEAWQEDSGEFATVAMQFSLIDTMVDQNGRIVAGDPAVPQQATELWTFTRGPGGSPADWKLAAIQQA
jgi:predicted lipid-binding transport protein (Tim44 family)